MGSRRLLIVLVAGLLFSAGGSALLRSVETPQDNPMLEALVLPKGSPTTTVPVTTTAGAPAPAPVVRRTPAPVAPRESTAEPVVLIGRIEIPKIGLKHDIYHGITMRNIDRGPSHWPGTAFPGEIGNAVFAGHRVTKTRPFNRIDELVVGDRVIFDIQGVRSVYAMTGSEIVLPTRLDIVNQTDTPTATLFACHPKGSAKFRYVVRLALVTE